jgi:tryptophan synthase alpha chain
MSRIKGQFEHLKTSGRKGFIPFVTAGDPDLATSLEIVLKLTELGADVIELGVPFSDPVADGPTIQRSSQRALEKGVTLLDVLALAKKAREKSETPIVLFSYMNPLLRHGMREVVDAAAEAGVDGILITDAVDDEAAEYASMLKSRELDLISLIAPTTSDERLGRIAKSSSGLLYAISRAGVTGARQEMSSEAEDLVARARRVTDLPIAVGFGISTAAQIENVWNFADAAVVGSAIVSEIEKARVDGAVDAVDTFVRRLLPQFAK